MESSDRPGLGHVLIFLLRKGLVYLGLTAPPKPRRMGGGVLPREGEWENTQAGDGSYQQPRHIYVKVGDTLEGRVNNVSGSLKTPIPSIYCFRAKHSKT